MPSWHTVPELVEVWEEGCKALTEMDKDEDKYITIHSEDLQALIDAWRTAVANGCKCE